MPKPKRLSGDDVVAILGRFGFAIQHQRGSHIKLIRILSGERQVLTIVSHAELKKGTIVGIFRQACRYVPESELREHFYG